MSQPDAPPPATDPAEPSGADPDPRPPGTEDEPIAAPSAGPAGRVALRAAVALVVVLVVAGLLWWVFAGAPPTTSNAVEVALPPQSAATLVKPAAPSPPPADLPPGADPALVERGADGFLPRVAADGREAWQAYAMPFDRADHRPRIAIVIGNLGKTRSETEAALQLPGPVTLAFSPYAAGLGDWVAAARAAHHEILIGVPMEPIDFPRDDPGPHSLLTTLSPKDNLGRLEWALSRAVGYVGITNIMGARFTATPNSLQPMLEAVKGRGLLFLEWRAASESAAPAIARRLALPYAADDRDLDGDVSREGVDRALAETEQVAREKGMAVAAGSGFPVTIERVAAWAAGLAGKGLVLAPVSAVVSEPHVAAGVAAPKAP